MKVNLCVGRTCMKDIKAICFSTETVSELGRPEAKHTAVKVKMHSDVTSVEVYISSSIENIHTINEKIDETNNTISLLFTMSDDASISLRITNDLELLEIQKEDNALYTEIRDKIAKAYNTYLNHLREGN
jgi:hypothetical protein